ncbi:coiled-coil domain-containing protein 136 isoform B [Alligator mississippiensis]|uniref:Coiled-coil domain-containing protein 136 isoform B n=1 Tax=Alligator mississippiensis TaxID=8496 RepID=A0A151M3Q3_ALLMI|nr:coiled-coil domain-containing protein 136 isoform B [Alligator mississippiensis]
MHWDACLPLDYIPHDALRTPPRTGSDAAGPGLAEEEEEEEEEAGEDEVHGLGLALTEPELEALQAQTLQLLEELEETRELALKHQDDSVELQGLLEDERLASARQAEIFTKQIQRLQAQMHTLQDEFSSLQEAKASELEEVEQELQEAQEELRGLRQATEEAAALHANEVATLQEQLCRLRAELHRAHVLRDDYELELASLRAEIHMKGGPRADAMAPREVAALQEELQALRGQYRDLLEEYQTLQESNKVMVHQLEKLEAQEYRARTKSEESTKLLDVNGPPRRSRSPRRASPRPSSSISFRPAAERAADGSRSQSRDGNEAEVTLRFQLQSEEEKVHLAQSKCDDMQGELRELQRLYQASRQEREQLMEELRLCREEIQRLNGTVPCGGRRLCSGAGGPRPREAAQVPAGGLKPILLFAVAAAALFLVPCFKKACTCSLPA